MSLSPMLWKLCPFGEPQERRGVSYITGTVPGKLVALGLVGQPEALT
jgi:hypothetical protein